MKKQFTLITFTSLIIGFIIYGLALADDGIDTNQDQHGQENQQLNDEMVSVVASILSQYDASNLSEADAKAINNSFREAGIRQGGGQREAIESTGFDARKISELDPPPNKKSDKKPQRKSGNESDRNPEGNENPEQNE